MPLVAGTLAVATVLSACSAGESTDASTTTTTVAPPPSWSELRTTYKPLLTKNGVSKGCNFAPDSASCFTGLYNASQALQSDIVAIPASASKSDVQGQIDNFEQEYSAYASGGSSTRLSALTLDISALGIWRALLQAT